MHKYMVIGTMKIFLRELLEKNMENQMIDGQNIERKKEFDYARGIAICLVVLGHMTTYPYTVNHPYCSNFKPPFLAARF